MVLELIGTNFNVDVSTQVTPEIKESIKEREKRISGSSPRNLPHFYPMKVPSHTNRKKKPHQKILIFDEVIAP